MSGVSHERQGLLHTEQGTVLMSSNSSWFQPMEAILSFFYVCCT